MEQEIIVKTENFIVDEDRKSTIEAPIFKIYSILNKEQIGFIHWIKDKNTYAFYPEDQSIWLLEDLKEIISLMEQQKQKWLEESK